MFIILEYVESGDILDDPTYPNPIQVHYADDTEGVYGVIQKIAEKRNIDISTEEGLSLIHSMLVIHRIVDADI